MSANSLGFQSFSLAAASNVRIEAVGAPASPARRRPRVRWIATVLVGLLLSAVAASSVSAEETIIDVRVRSQGGKFVGTSMGGARVVIRNAETGEILAKGITRGSTGDTERIMKESHRSGEPLSTPDAAVFRAKLDLDEPTQILVEASGPLAQPQAINRVTATQWIIPGKDITEGDGVLLVLPGFVVDILSPPAHVKMSGTPQTVDLTANIVLMCGCPIEPGGLWDSEDYEIRAILKGDGKVIDTLPLEYAGKTSQFHRELHVHRPGVYEATVYAHDPKNGNTGLDKVTFIVEE